MKRFVLYAPGMVQPEQEIWQQAGFDINSEGTEAFSASQGAGIDAVWVVNSSSLAPVSEEQAGWQKIYQLRPKLFILQTEKNGMLPDCWRESYALNEYGTGRNHWVVGTKIEAPLPDDMGALLSEKNTAALAEFFYYYLLRDVFRETADWCGHMSSVVGRM
jgi:hypothetical protein